MKDYILSLINQMIEEKQNNNIFPTHVITNDLYKRIMENAKNTLNQLYKEDKIQVGKTVNDTYITISKDNENK